MPRPIYDVKEAWTGGIDPLVQGVGAGPRGWPGALGLRVPTLATPNARDRYLFNLCALDLNDGEYGTIVGIRQLWSLFVQQSLGVDAPTAVAWDEQDVTSPLFRLPDGNVSWHLMRLARRVPESYGTAATGPVDLDGFKFLMSKSPALLYQTATLGTSGFYVDITAYTPPNSGAPPGEAVAGLGQIPDGRWDWRNSQGWSSASIPIFGPATYMLFASVRQSSGVYSVPVRNANAFPPTPESNFVNAYGTPAGSSLPSGVISSTGVIIGRVAGALVAKIDRDDGLVETGCPGQPFRVPPAQGAT